MTGKLANVSTEGKPWAIYLRLSKAEAAEDSGKTKAQRIALTNVKLDGHLAEIVDWLEERGMPWDPALVFRDPGLSAWKKSVRRPDWERMMSLAHAGELAGIGIVAIDRFTRDVATMEGLIDLALTFKVNIGGPRAGDLDLTTMQGIQQARGMAMQAANESMSTSFRILATMDRKMKAGQPMGGGRSFGFERGGMVQRPDEVAALRHVVQQFLDGVPMAHCADELNAAGMTTARGHAWSGTVLARVLMGKRYGGHVEHHGVIVGRIKGDPVLDADTFDALQAKLLSRKRGRRPTNLFVLTNILECQCGHPMNGARSGHVRAGTSEVSRTYRCTVVSGGCGNCIMGDHVEAMVDVHMRALLAEPANVAQIVAEDNGTAAARDERLAQLETIDEQLTILEDRRAAGILGESGGLTQAQYDKPHARYDKARQRLLAELADLTPAAVAERFNPALKWDDADTDDRRILLRRYGVRIVARRRDLTHPQNIFDPRRVRIL
jgi:DNA invertase Pin-like site-specific DNA recombinase